MSSTMSPETSPGAPAKNSGVRRVNNIPIYIALGIMGVFLIVMAMVAIDRADQQQAVNEDEVEEADTNNNNLLASIITGDFMGDGIIEAEQPPATISIQQPDETEQNILIARPENLDLPPLPPDSHLYHDINPDMEHIRQLKRQQFEEAVMSGISVPKLEPERADEQPDHVSYGGASNRDETLKKLAAIRKEKAALRNEDPATTYLSRLQQVREQNNFGGLVGDGLIDDSAPVLLDVDTARPDNNFSDFDGQKERWRLDSQPERPETPYSLLTGFVIPAVLISGINSDLPGQIMAQVSHDVFDTPIGEHRLIPQGARLVGSYSSDVVFGQKRVLVAWQRIIFPDGKTMDIGAMPGADAIGQSGYSDLVNNHYLRIFGSALLMSAVIAGAAYSQRDAGSNFGRQNAGSILSQSLGQQLGMATARLLNKNLNIAPTLQIRPGFRFNVVVTKDMIFSKPYQSFD